MRRKMLSAALVNVCIFLCLSIVAKGQIFPIPNGSISQIFPIFREQNRPQPSNAPCRAESDGRSGTCTTNSDCSTRGGVADGDCPSSSSYICCIPQATCSETITKNNSYFVNLNYPSTINTSGNCIVTINRVGDNICQLRLDFVEFELAPPIGGSCRMDQLNVVGVNGIPVICGYNSGLHVYVDFPKGVNSVPLSVVTTGHKHNRLWNIKVSQIECNSPSIAPSGCFLYYKGPSGSLRSFNYDAPEEYRGYQSGLNYGICLRRESGFCGIRYNVHEPFEVGVEPNASEVRANTEGTCNKDFIMIPNGALDLQPVGSNRFCGNRFHAQDGAADSALIYSHLMPFVIYYVTDKTSDYKLGRGFSLDWQQTPCTGYLSNPRCTVVDENTVD